ncbi:DnaA regulatory inactivator Hda (Homologous to DnaA) [hydrothermal vent metagenome]|uniref:DnaA regulatory inactivator Hda (Homologous to DnaA) n=1 Tax=hydrothermal vent metagenome TaxID=652676 RepID=A0A1W1CSZ3_9ZZZZ
MQQQLPIQLNCDFLFDNWQQTETNATIYELLRSLNFQVVYCYSKKTLGKTHLLQSVTQYALKKKLTTVYLDFKTSLDDNILDNFFEYDLLCLDNIQRLSQTQQYSLFELYNKNRAKLVLSSDCQPQQLDYVFKDVKTRLSRANVFELCSYSDEELKNILKRKAQIKSLNIEDNIYDYLLKWTKRDLGNLLNIMDKAESICAIRKLKKVSINLLKEIITS